MQGFAGASSSADAWDRPSGTARSPAESAESAGSSEPGRIERYAWGCEETFLDGKSLRISKLHLEDGATLRLSGAAKRRQAWILVSGRIDVESEHSPGGGADDPVLRPDPGEVIRVTAVGRATLLAVRSGFGPDRRPDGGGA